MLQTTFNCEIITPMAMYGADGVNPEVRVAGLKGMLRFWWRAVRCDDNISALKKKEEAIFGGTGANAGKSNTRIILDINIDKTKDLISIRELLPGGRYDGISYLLYSMIMQGRSEQKKKSLKPGIKFKLKIISEGRGSIEALDVHKNALASFWTAVHFGGFGGRARRGGGNLSINSVEDNTGALEEMGLSYIPEGSDNRGIARWLLNNIATVSKTINSDKKIEFTSTYSNLSMARFLISREPFNDWESALNEIGLLFKEYRNNVKGEIYDSAAFGFPIRHRNGTTVTGKHQNNNLGRRSSPIIFKVIKSRNGQYYWLAIRLSGEFLPEGGIIKADYKTQKPDYRLIDDFWFKMKKNADEHLLLKPEKLSIIKEKLIKDLHPDQIIIFGSRARGNHHKNSDIDIAVKTNKSIEISDINITIDLVNINKIDEGFKKKIEQEGVIIYERKS